MAVDNEELVDAQVHPLLPFLQAQPPAILSRLYQSPASCLGIFRLLSALERQLVMNLLWLESAISPSTMAAWVIKDRRKLYDEALQNLHKLNILPNANTKFMALSSAFRTGLRQAMTGGGTAAAFEAKPGNPSTVMLEDVDAYATERWETILHYMVSSGTGRAPKKPSAGVLFLLKRSGLMSGNANVQQITSVGFQFLLHQPGTQLWDLLLSYLNMAQEREMDLVEVVTFLCTLATMELGKEYTTQNFSQAQAVMLEDLMDYGLIWMINKQARIFTPTRLATSLMTSLSSPNSALNSKADVAQDGYIILETNYRLYAYTDNALQTAILDLFVSLKYRFQNLVVGMITRESVRKALSNGITADQIISFLISHAHPQMRKNNPLLPVTVQDQIRLWELERNRLKSYEGYLYSGFLSQNDYEFVLGYAHELGVVVWESPLKRSFFARLEGHANIREFITRRDKPRASQAPS